MAKSQSSGAQGQAGEKKKKTKKPIFVTVSTCFTALSSNFCQNSYRRQGTDSERQNENQKNNENELE